MADATTHLVYSPHDASLYVERAYHLLNGNGFGPFHSRLFIKLPGFSFLLAAVRQLAIPYLFFLNVFFALSAGYFVWALYRLAFPMWVCLVTYAVILVHPVSLEMQWLNVMREPVSVCFWLLVFGSMLHIARELENPVRALAHILCLSLVFGFCQIFREDEKTLWLAIFLFVIGLCMRAYLQPGNTGWRRVCVPTLVVTLVLVSTLLQRKAALRFVQHFYGVRILHDLSEGEYPKMLASIRSIKQRIDNRHVMYSQEKMRRLADVVPEFRKTYQLLPPPSRNSQSCLKVGICSEWNNGHFVFWVKDSAFAAGDTPSAVDAESFFRKIRSRIEEGCRRGAFECRPYGNGLLPPFEMRWTRAFVEEWKYLMGLTFLAPRSTFQAMPRAFSLFPDFGRMHQVVTMTHHFDSLDATAENWKGLDLQKYLRLKYWLENPDVANNPHYGFGGDLGMNGGRAHYKTHGKSEGRAWEPDEGIGTQPLMGNYRFAMRSTITKWFVDFEKYSLLLGGITFLLFFVFSRALTPELIVAGTFYVFLVGRNCALAYVSVYMGNLDIRLFFGAHVILIAVSIGFIGLALHPFVDSAFRSVVSYVQRMQSHIRNSRHTMNGAYDSP